MKNTGLPVRLTRVLLTALLAVGTVAGTAEPTGASAAHNDTSATLTGELRQLLDAYLTQYAPSEHVSAVSLSVNLPNRRETIEARAGTMRFGGGRPVPSHSLWQIGSNTKAFTAVLVLKLEAEHRLSIDDTVGKWLPQYPQWRDVTIRRLLNLTSGIPTYDLQPAFQADYAANPYTDFSAERLISYAVPGAPTSGWYYSNTNYILAQMIIEKVSRDSYAHQLYSRILRPLGLHDLHYRPHLYPTQLTVREPAGYFYDRGRELPTLFGRDVSRYSLSWTQGTGGMLGTTQEMTRWERVLFSGRVLPATQQAELTSLVSLQTGQPIDRTSPADPAGYGLGVGQFTADELGTFWGYEGGTLGFRTVLIYFPPSGLIMAIGLNSHSDPDNIFTLAVAVYNTLVSHRLIPSTAQHLTARAG